MVGVEKSSPYREALIGLIYAIDQEVNLEEKDQVLMVMSLDTEDKISRFNQWIKKVYKGEKLTADRTEIVRAAVKIGKDEM